MVKEARKVTLRGVYNEALVLDRPVSLIGAGMENFYVRERNKYREGRKCF